MLLTRIRWCRARSEIHTFPPLQAMTRLLIVPEDNTLQQIPQTTSVLTRCLCVSVVSGLHNRCRAQPHAMPAIDAMPIALAGIANGFFIGHNRAHYSRRNK